MNKKSSFTAVLFAGGESRRMGVDKATLVVDGTLLWRRQLEVLRQLRPEQLWVSARARPAWCPGDVEVVLDEPPSRGPRSGLAATLPRLRTTHLLALAIDLPNMTAGHLEKLQALARPGCGVIPMNEDFFEPLCAIYPIEAAAETAGAAGDDSLQTLARGLIRQNLAVPHVLEPGEKLLYRNVNQPEDL